jgi:hypothetical protein
MVDSLRIMYLIHKWECEEGLDEDLLELKDLMQDYIKEIDQALANRKSS